MFDHKKREYADSSNKEMEREGTSMTDTLNLLPCPFCGIGDRLFLNPAHNNPGNEAWVSCRACDASSKMCVASAGKSAEQWAAEFWNTRAEPTRSEIPVVDERKAFESAYSRTLCMGIT
jgi:hypothetical protein